MANFLAGELHFSCRSSDRRFVSLKTLAGMVDAHRSTVRRWLAEAGIQPVSMSRGRNGAIRYRWQDIQAWLSTRHEVD